MKISNGIKRYLPIMGIIIFTLLSIELLKNFQTVSEKVIGFLSIIEPFIYSFIIAYVLNPIVKLFEKVYGGRRVASVFSTYMALGLLVVMISIYIFPKIWGNVYELYVNFPMIVRAVKDWSVEIVKHEKISTLLTLGGISDIRPDTIFSKISEYIQSYSAYMIKATVATAVTIGKWIFALLVSIYVLIYKEYYKAFFIKIMLKFFGKRKSRKFFRLSRTIHKMIGMYIGTKAIDSMIIGGIALIGLSIMGSPFVFLLAFIVFVTNMIPYFGPFVGIAVTSTVHLFYSPELAINSLIFLFLLQQFDAWFLDPKLIGNKVGLNPFLVIFAVTLGGGLYGPVGMLLATPIMATIKIYLDIFLRRNRDLVR